MLPVSLVIPTYNEAENIVDVLSTAHEASQIIVVDSSNDGTIEAIEKAGYGERVNIIQTPPTGKGHALRRGFNIATQPYVVIADADGSMDLGEMHDMCDLLSQGFDVVKGSRKLGGSHDITPWRALGNWALTTAFNSLYNTTHTDLCYGYIGFQRDVLKSMDLKSSGFEIESELIAVSAKMGLDIAEFPSWEYPRLSGKSNLKPVRDGLRVLNEIMRNR
jgi:glycosyltransferase involved in cell wall biosynthesis